MTWLRGPSWRDLIPDTPGLPVSSQHLWKSAAHLHATDEPGLTKTWEDGARLSPSCSRPQWVAGRRRLPLCLLHSGSFLRVREHSACCRAFAPAGTRPQTFTGCLLLLGQTWFRCPSSEKPALTPKPELPHPARLPAPPCPPSLRTLSALHSSSVSALVVFLCPASPQTEPRTAPDL